MPGQHLPTRGDGPDRHDAVVGHEVGVGVEALDRPGRGVGAPHEADRPAGRAAAGQRLHRRPDVGEVDPRPRPALEDRALLHVPVEDGRHRVLDGEDEARRRLGRHALHADVEPHRRVERRPLVEQEVLQLVAEGVGLGLVGEVAVAHAPVGDGVGHPVDDLAERRLPLGRAQLTPEVLLGDDVRGVLRPGDRELDAGLEEGVAAGLVVRDPGVTALPLHRVVGVLPRPGEVPSDADSRPGPAPSP